MDKMIGESVGNLKEEPGKREEVVLECAYDLARRIGVMLLQRLDEELREGREEGLRLGCQHYKDHITIAPGRKYWPP